VGASYNGSNPSVATDGWLQNLGNMYYVYLLRSKKDLGFYIGYTADLRKRFIDHIEGLVESTKHRRPLELIYYEAYLSEVMAREREEKLKDFGSAYVALLKRLGQR
jgi:putative endonuclease